MWIVSIALRRPYTFVVLAVLIVLLGITAIARMPIDILPAIRIPIIASVWSFAGMQPQDMANRIVLNSERTAQTLVTDVEHSESQSLNGQSIVKYYFQPNVSRDLAYAQIAAVSNTLLRNTPPGTSPPFTFLYDASTVPIIQLAVSSATIPEAQLFDAANTGIRVGLAGVAGAAIPFPYGGKIRQVQVDLDSKALSAQGLSASDVSAAISSQNLILPAGTQKISDLEYFIRLNASFDKPDDLNNVPIRTINGVTTFVRDVAHVRDGYPPQTNIVRLDSRRGLLLTVLKTGSASTLDVIAGIRERLPAIRSLLPAGVKVSLLGDQSIFVKAAVSGVIREGALAAALTAVMILLFLGSWRSTLIIAISIPLSALASILCLWALDESINIMTLGGLALAVGILVDDATVTIENINLHLEQGKDVEAAIMDGAWQIALPAFVSTLSICIVFVPMFFLSGTARFLFVPMAEAVIFAMLASYVLSRTLVPTLAKYWLRSQPHHGTDSEAHLPVRVQYAFERSFNRLRERYRVLLTRAVGTGPRFILAFLAVAVTSALIAFPIGPLPGLGQDFFPSVDAGQIKLHLRTRTGTRIEETTALCDRIEVSIRRQIPVRYLESIADNVGVPNSGINIMYGNSAPIGPGDADIFISLKPGHPPTERIVRDLRLHLNQEFAGVTFAFLPADIVNQILNFGIPAPLDIQISGPNLDANRGYAYQLLNKLRAIPGAVDLRVHQTYDYPQIQVDVDRARAQGVGLTQQTVASNLLVSLSGSFQTTPSFWVDPKTGTSYNVTTQTPQYRLNSLNDLNTLPISIGGSGTQLLANLGTIHRSVAAATVSHFNAANILDIYGSASGADLGYVAGEVGRAIKESAALLPRNAHVVVRGQSATMQSAFRGLLIGLAAAIVLVYLLIVVNFQSWTDPFIIITALPAALAGVVWALFLTGTTVSVPALTGAIMCMGVATANSILVVSFARERLDAGLSAHAAALEAGYTRLRPVLMTALAMIIGMLPMAMGMGEGGEQNAPLGRAVIGGLCLATVATIFFVPAVFAQIHGRRAGRQVLPTEDAMTESTNPSHTGSLRLWGWLALLIILALVAFGVFSRLHARALLRKEAIAELAITVNVVRPTAEQGGENLELPATTEAYMDSPIYARTSGYLKSWKVDIGAHVKKGQLLAEVETPEVDQQARQAEADLAVAAANSRLAEVTSARQQQLLTRGLAAQQDADNARGDAEAKAASVRSARANAEHFRELQSFKRIVAPFDGIITARHTDIGALVSAGSGSAAPELFHIAAASKLRIYIGVPQAYAAQIRPKLSAEVTIAGNPGIYQAKVVATAQSIDPGTRTLRAELELDNARDELLPGTYVTVRLKLPAAAGIRTLRLPAEALLFRHDGLSVVKVGPDNRTRIQPITVGRDFGDTVEVLSGVDPDDRVILNPPESATPGTPVRIAGHTG
jgi:RND family efflux transporter MFP subunit